MLLPLFAVHISDGILDPAWLWAGFAFMAIAVLVATVRIPQEMIPKLGVLTAVFFVASQIHLPLGPMSVHLILNGLLGILLGGRCVLAIAVGLALQAFLVGHGGYTSLGVNFAVMAIPALACGWIFQRLPMRFRMVPGFFLGAFTAVFTVLLNTLVLSFGAKGDWAVIARTSVVLHIPIIVLEGVIAASTLRVLVKARPDWLGLPDQAVSGNTSENGTSH